jgi:two-component system, OmpR family, response regulator VicR
MKNLKLLLVEDDPNLGLILKEYLEVKGFETTLCNHGSKALEVFNSAKFDICILDVMLPGKDGFTIGKEIRNINKVVPIIFLTAKAMKEDTISGLKIGADDYVTKPFSMEELLLRIKAILRRTNPDNNPEPEKQVFKIGKYTFDYDRHILTFDDQNQKLTSKESELLRLLCINLNQAMDRTTALKYIWKDDSYFNARSMDVYITKLRKYLKLDEEIQILTLHGEGFKLLFTGKT